MGCPVRGQHSRFAGDSSRTAPRAAGSRYRRQDTLSGCWDTAPGAARLRRGHRYTHSVTVSHLHVPSVGTARTPHQPEGDSPYPALGADASKRGTWCPGGHHRRVTGSARGPGRRWWRGDSSAPCRHSMRPAGARPTRHSGGRMMCPPPLNVPMPPPTPYLGHGAASPGAAGRHAAGGIVGTLRLSVGTGDSVVGCGEWGQGEGPPCLPPRPTHVPPPRVTPPVPGDTMQDLPSVLQWDPRGQQRWPPVQGTP